MSVPGNGAPLFSVIVPVYNRAELVGSTLASVCVQEFADFEIIAVDDGSTDDSLRVLRQWEAQTKGRLRVFTQPNRGLGATRNVAAREARGQYLAFLDSDDLWFPWALSAAAEAIRRFDAPSFICGNYVRFADEHLLTAPARTEFRFSRHNSFLDSRGKGFSWSTSSAVVREDVFGQAGGFAEIRFNCEDQDFWLRIGTAEGFITIDSPPTTALRRGGRHKSMVSAYANTVRGFNFVIDNERAGRYPGGRGRAADRRRLIAGSVRSFLFASNGCDSVTAAARMYRRTLGWNAADAQWSFILGYFPRLLRNRLLRSREGR